MGIMNSGSYDYAGGLRQGQLVLVEGLEQLAKQILTLQSKSAQAVTDRIMSREAFALKISQTEIGSLSTEEIELLLRFLSRDKQLVSYDAHTVKFKAPSSHLPEPITQEDSSIASIKALIASLESQISALTSRVATLQTTAQNAVQSKDKHGALSALRSKRLAKRNLQQRTDTLNQLEEVWTKIEQAVDHVQVMQVMQSSAETLKSLNKRVGGVDRVDAIVDDLREQMGQVDEVSQIIQEPLDGKAIVDEAEIDDELAAMEKEESVKKEELESEATKARLAELEQPENVAKETVAQVAEERTQDDPVEQDLENSSQKLEKVHLNDGKVAREQSRSKEAQPAPA